MLMMCCLRCVAGESKHSHRLLSNHRTTEKAKMLLVWCFNFDINQMENVSISFFISKYASHLSKLKTEKKVFSPFFLHSVRYLIKSNFHFKGRRERRESVFYSENISGLKLNTFLVYSLSKRHFSFSANPCQTSTFHKRWISFYEKLNAEKSDACSNSRVWLGRGK